MKIISLLQVILASVVLILIIGSNLIYKKSARTYPDSKKIELLEKLEFSSNQKKYVEAIEHLSQSRGKMASAYFIIAITTALGALICGIFIYKRASVNGVNAQSSMKH
jgi:hypothetical protein